VIVDNLYVSRTLLGPPKAQPPLVVDPDAVLPGAIAWITGRSSQELERGGSIERASLRVATRSIALKRLDRPVSKSLRVSGQ